MERRAASIHLHIDGERGPSNKDVSNAALHALSSLLDHVNGGQLGYIMRSAFDNLDGLNGWIQKEHCCWLAQKTADWARYQYRYAVPTWLVERLLESQETPTATPQHTALVSMITTVFSSPTPLINLSTSDIISNLITFLIKRTHVNANDALLPSLVECISSLGCHVYYADQIQDLAVRSLVHDAYRLLTSLVGRAHQQANGNRDERHIVCEQARAQSEQSRVYPLFTCRPSRTHRLRQQARASAETAP